MANVLDVASYILQQLAPKEPEGITTWKLQKLVYYSQAWALIWDDAPLFDAPIQAWANGPVVPQLYDQHRGDFRISRLPVGKPDALQDWEKETIDAVIAYYGERTAKQLSDLTHDEAPWREARAGMEPGERGTTVITLDSMALYYGGLYAEREKLDQAKQQ